MSVADGTRAGARVHNARTGVDEPRFGGMRIAVTQFELRPEPAFDSFAQHLGEVVTNAAAAGADLVVLPELVTTGLLASHPDADRLTAADLAGVYRTLFPSYTQPYTELLRRLAMDLSVAIGGGSHFRRADDGTYRNTGYLAHPDGRVEQQDKLHLTPQELALGATPGDSVLVSTIGPARVGLQICADIEFPEVARYLAVAGVEVVLCPSLTWNRRGAYRIRHCSLARSVENQLFVAASPLLGSCGVPRDGALHGTGRSFVSCPIDRTFGVNDGLLAEEESGHEALLVADLDLARIARSRANPEPPGLTNARPELYQRLMATLGERP